MSERAEPATTSPSLYSALTSPISRTFAEQRKHLGYTRGFSLDVIHDFMMPAQQDPRSRRALESSVSMEIERKNLLGLTQLIVKDVIELSMPLDRTVTGQFQPLQHLFGILEQILQHGFRHRKGGVLTSKIKDIWSIFESLESACPESKAVAESCRNLSQIETSMGKVRAWIRLSLMQKKLPDYFKSLVDNRDSLVGDLYDSGAMIMNDESSVVAGLLVGLNFIDYNLCVKDEDLDHDYQIISLLPYLKIRSQPGQEPPQSDGELGLKAILDQKNYLEELNTNLKKRENQSVQPLCRKLAMVLRRAGRQKSLPTGSKFLSRAQMANLETKMEGLTTSNVKLTLDLEETKKQFNVIQLENHEMKTATEKIQKSTQEDLSMERETYQTSRQGLDSLNASMQNALDRESALRHELERELKLQTNIRSEAETAMKLMEREVQEKQELMLALRKQLDDLKLVNLEMYQKLQTAEATLRHKSDLIARMEQKMHQMGDTMLQLGNKIQILENERRTIEETARKLSMQLAETDMTRSVLETDLRMEQEDKANLIGSLTEQEEKLEQMQGEVESIRNISQNYEKLRNEHEYLQKMSHEQEETLAELGSHLSEQKVRVAEMKDLTNQFDPTTQQWEKDAINCKLCDKPFTVARRKHHCRHCGGTFCNPCSDNKMPLPSSPKPVRVCDNCHILLLRRYATTK